MKYCLVTQRLEKVLPDVPGPEDEVSGKVRFTPSISRGGSFQVDTDEGAVTVPAAPVEAEIVAGVLTHGGEPGVRLFAGGENSNPRKVVWRAEYVDLRVNGHLITLSGLSFEAVPGGEVDLTSVTPVVGSTPPGVTKGDPGEDGSDGLTPRIVDGMWWIGDESTGVPARGPKGDAGEAPPRSPRVLLYDGTETPDLSDFPDAIVGDEIERTADGQRWKVEES